MSHGDDRPPSPANDAHRRPPVDRRDYPKRAGTADGGSFAATDGGVADPGLRDAPPAPTDLRVEYERDPNNVPAAADAPPRFAWELPSSVRCYDQSAYRILVASSRSAVESREADVWDSGRVGSERSTAVSFQGHARDADATYHWAVRVWDGEGTPSAWSSPATFTTALPDDQWRAEWIQADLTEPGDTAFETVDPLPLLRTEFDVEKGIRNARVHVSGLGFYELYLNGDRVGDRVLDPARTNYNGTVLYTTYDVTDHLATGANAVGVALGHGRPGESHERTDVPWRSDDPVLRLQLHVEFADGTATTVVSDESWTATDGPTRWDSLLAGQEFHDAREERPGWTTAGYDDADWGAVTTTPGPDGEMAPQRVQPVVVHDAVEPVEMWEPEDGVYVYDLGQLIAGWVELTVDGEPGARVKLREAERLADDGTVETVEFGAEFLWQEYVLHGDGPETWEPRFTYGGFRYVQVEGHPGTPTLDSVRAKVVHTAVDDGETGSFACSNDLFERIHDNTRWAMLNNLHGIHTDSPTWEKLGWTEAYVELGEALSANFSMARFWEKFLQDCRDSQLDDGDVPYVIPNEGTSFEGWGWDNDPGWDAATVITAWHAYQYTGDRRFLADHYESMRRYVEFVEAEAEGGAIVRTGLGDWNSPGFPGRPPEGPLVVSTACYYRAVELVRNAAVVLGNPDDAREFEHLRADVRQAFNAEFLDEAENVYRTGEATEYRQTSNLYPLSFDLVPESRREAVLENLVHDVRVTRDGHLNTGAHGLRHLFPVLSEHGYHDLAYTVATRRTYPSWGHWLDHDVTGLLEDWSLDARSRSHDFLGSVDEWFYQYVAGVREPVEPGYRRIRIRPRPVDDLDWAEAEVQTVRGTLRSRWERVETPDDRTPDGVVLDATIPGNATAEIHVPTFGGGSVGVSEGGIVAWIDGARAGPSRSGVEDAWRTDDSVVFEVGSGDYRFELEHRGADVWT